MLKYIYRILENPRIYDLAQRLLGGERIHRAIREVIDNHLRGIRYNTVLDVGCGTGSFADCFKGEYTGIDINQDYIRKAGTKGNGHFMVADATALPFGPETFDLVFTLGLLHHVDPQNQIRILGEMWRVCKKGGHILIMDGLVPSDRLNIIGYALAKLDRGRFKVRAREFKEMIAFAYPDADWVRYTDIKSFPYEFVAVMVGR